LDLCPIADRETSGDVSEQLNGSIVDKFESGDLRPGAISLRIDALNNNRKASMRVIQITKRLAGFALALWCAALVAGCHSAKSSEPTPYSPGPSGSTSDSSSAQSTTASSSGEVSIPLYEEQIAVGTRTIESGSVRLRKLVTTETVNHPVQIRRETLVIERESGAGTNGKEPAGTSTPFEQNEIVIQLHQEEPVVEKKIVPTGRIVAQTRTNSEQVTVQREVRRENVDVEKIGNPKNVTIAANITERSKTEAAGGTGSGSEQVKGSQAPAGQKVDYRENGTAPDGKGTLTKQ
jgi:uncharacterized protein (TIGR02271 family)